MRATMRASHAERPSGGCGPSTSRGRPRTTGSDGAAAADNAFTGPLDDEELDSLLPGASDEEDDEDEVPAVQFHPAPSEARPPRAWSVVLAAALLAACVASLPGGRAEVVRVSRERARALFASLHLYISHRRARARRAPRSELSRYVVTFTYCVCMCVSGFEV